MNERILYFDLAIISLTELIPASGDLKWPQVSCKTDFGFYPDTCESEDRI